MQLTVGPKLQLERINGFGYLNWVYCEGRITLLFFGLSHEMFSHLYLPGDLHTDTLHERPPPLSDHIKIQDAQKQVAG